MTRQLDLDTPNVSEQRAGDCSEALLVCSALALAWRSHLVVRDRQHARSLVAEQTGHVTADVVLRWRERTRATTWNTRWEWAVRVVRRCLPELAGAGLPRNHWDAPLPRT